MTDNLRFTVGQDYTFLRILFDQKTPRFSRLYLPWEDKLTAIETVTLTCMEHHKVAWDQDPDEEKKHDGFIFKDAEGNIWHNQYPSASYGQLDDTNDRIVRRHFETEELLAADENGQPLKGADGQSIRKDGSDERWKIFDSQFWSPFELATTKLSNIYRAVNPLERDKQRLSDVEQESLKDHLAEVIKKVEEASSKKVVFAPLVFKYKDDRPDHVSEIMRAKLVDLVFETEQYKQAVARNNREKV